MGVLNCAAPAPSSLYDFINSSLVTSKNNRNHQPLSLPHIAFYQTISPPPPNPSKPETENHIEPHIHNMMDKHTHIQKSATLFLCLHEAFVSTLGRTTKKQSHHTYIYIYFMFPLCSTFVRWCWRLVRHCRLYPRFDIVPHSPVPTLRVSSGADNALHIIASLTPLFAYSYTIYPDDAHRHCTLR